MEMLQQSVKPIIYLMFFCSDAMSTDVVFLLYVKNVSL